jgi:threonine/homoserine/homoserine lactone efflux protein
MFYMDVQTMANGAKAGWLSAFAFHLASYIHILLAAIGITVLLNTAPHLLLILKLAGASYLVWMGADQPAAAQFISHWAGGRDELGRTDRRPRHSPKFHRPATRRHLRMAQVT